MAYNKFSYFNYNGDNNVFVDLDCENSEFSVMLDITSRGLLVQWAIGIESVYYKREFNSGPISCDIDHYEILGTLPKINVYKRDAMPFFFGNKIGQCSYYDGDHNDLSGSFKIFRNDNMQWIHLESDIIKVNAKIKFKGYIFQDKQKDEIFKMMLSDNIKLEISKAEIRDYGQGQMLIGRIAQQVDTPGRRIMSLDKG